MNKYLLLSAAAALTATGAQAGTATHSFTFANSSGAPYCDGGTVYTNGTPQWAWQHTNANCASAVTNGQGSLGVLSGVPGKKKAKKYADMSDNLEAVIYGSSSVAVNFQLPQKIKQGAAWSLTVEFGGTTSFIGNSGILINTTPGHKGGKSTAAALKTLIQAHRNAAHHA